MSVSRREQKEDGQTRASTEQSVNAIAARTSDEDGEPGHGRREKGDDGVRETERKGLVTAPRSQSPLHRITFPLAFSNVRAVLSATERKVFMLGIKRTSLLHLQFGVVLALGLLIAMLSHARF